MPPAHASSFPGSVTGVAHHETRAAPSASAVAGYYASSSSIPMHTPGRSTRGST
jgi:hypothetical protein